MSVQTKYLSPESSFGSMGMSVVVHVVIAMLVVGTVHYTKSSDVTLEEYIDLDYQVFDAPPEIVPEEKRVISSPEPKTQVDHQTIPDNTPKELQDESSDIAGTQEASKENNLGSENNGNSTATPYYKIKPKYPRAALMAGTEGWILMEIDINVEGVVEDAEVIDGVNRNSFQSEARRAVLQWRYRPFLNAEGQAIAKINHQVRVDFKLEEAGSTVADY